MSKATSSPDEGGGVDRLEAAAAFVGPAARVRRETWSRVSVAAAARIASSTASAEPASRRRVWVA